MVRTPFYDKSGLRKGAWTVEEDIKLTDYITRYGSWNWQLLPQFAGLARSGKSCRSRWMNYLRPGVQRGNYTRATEEERISRMQKQLASRPIESEPSEQSTAHDTLRNIPNEHQKFLQTSQPISFTGYARSCVKVYKKGLLFGMSVNLTQLSGYDELVHKLDQLFEFGGELISSPKNWLVVYDDDDKDIMVVGGDPWQEFVVYVRNIYIYPKEEFQKMSRPIESEPSEQSTAHDTLRNIANDHQKFLQTSQPISFTGYARSCVKVYKKGLLFGMSVNLTQLSGYDELVHKLDQLFEFGGELISSPKNWLVVYDDDDKDIMVVGGDPWQEFVVYVRNIYIYPKEEFQKMRKDERLHEGSDNEMPNREKEFLHMQLQDHRHAERLHKGSNSEMHYQENDNLHKQFRGKQKIGDSVCSWSLLTDSDTNVTLSNSHGFSGPS